MANKRTAFTLIEILVVLAIIGILSALLFPAFGRAREGGRQTSCAAHLHEIGLAVSQYYGDYRRYPAKLRYLLPSDALADDGSPTGTPNIDGAGYLKSGSDALKCLSDDTDYAGPRSSYGDLTVGTVEAAYQTNPALRSGFSAGAPTGDDAGRYVWNFWGYTNEGIAYQTEAEATAAAGSNTALLVNPAAAYNAATNPLKYSLSNRYSPGETVVTHCVYHRSWSAANLDYPGEIYSDPARGLGGRDIVLRKDGSAKSVDVSACNSSPSQWETPKY